jgi:hypothetical protein
MGKYSQERLPRLAIVGSHGTMQHPRPAAERWWESQRTLVLSFDHAEKGTPTACYSEMNPRMVVMPGPPQGWLVTALCTLWRKVASWFTTPDPMRRPPVVLSFRRHALRSQSFRPVFAGETFAGKKNNGSVHWNHD